MRPISLIARGPSRTIGLVRQNAILQLWRMCLATVTAVNYDWKTWKSGDSRHP